MLLVCELKWDVGIVFVFSSEGTLVVVAEAYAGVEDHVDIKRIERSRPFRNFDDSTSVALIDIISLGDPYDYSITRVES